MTKLEPVVYVVEDDDLARRLIIALTESIGLTCEPYENAREFLDDFDTDHGGCLVLDVLMPGMTGLELQSELNRRGAIIPVIFFTGHDHIRDAVAAMRQGAFNYLLKPFGHTELITNLRRALEYDRRNRRTVAQFERIRERIMSLTPREREVLALLARGCVNKTIAEEMRLSQRTVELHRSRLMEKMGADSLAQLVRMLLDFEHRHGHPQ